MRRPRQRPMIGPELRRRSQSRPGPRFATAELVATTPTILQATYTTNGVVCKSLKRGRRGFDDSSSPSSKRGVNEHPSAGGSAAEAEDSAVPVEQLFTFVWATWPAHRSSVKRQGCQPLEPGPAVHCRAGVRQWLAFLHRDDALAPSCTRGQRATEARLSEFVAELRARVAP
jgi:hypothetical protein